MSFNLNPVLTYEQVGEDVLVHDAGSGLVARVSGEHASALRHLSGSDVEAMPSTEVLTTLESLGVVVNGEPVQDGNLISRRNAVRLAAGTAAVGITVLALPNAAAAASEGPGPGPGPTTTTTPPPPPDVDPTLTGLVYPPAGQAAGNTVGVRWQQGSASSGFTYSVTFSGPGITTFTVGGLSSSDGYSNISIPGWTSGTVLTVAYNTEGGSPNVAGDSRTATRVTPDPDLSQVYMSITSGPGGTSEVNLQWSELNAGGPFGYTYSASGVTASTGSLSGSLLSTAGSPGTSTTQVFSYPSTGAGSGTPTVTITSTDPAVVKSWTFVVPSATRAGIFVTGIEDTNRAEVSINWRRASSTTDASGGFDFTWEVVSGELFSLATDAPITSGGPIRSVAAAQTLVLTTIGYILAGTEVILRITSSPPAVVSSTTLDGGYD